MSELVYFFPGGTEAPLAAVGGKGFSLMRTAAELLPVPPGFVLAVDFFREWLDQLKTSRQWSNLCSRDADTLRAACDDLKALSARLSFSPAQRGAIKQALQQIGGTIFAVRSSSPEEDLDGASFAGGYETVLGVTEERLEAAISKVFAACLDYRVAVYKTEHGFDAASPRIAIVVQRQIASDVSGVAFSIDPISNDYDRAVFNANWGLGETVVAGTATPDTFVVDKLRGRIILRHAGKKETSLWLTKGGGTNERADPRHDELTLSDEQLGQLTALVTKVERIYGKPVDCEWAYESGALYLLQARPVTGFVPLLPEMQTEPGGRRRLYLDATISIQGIFKPLSPMGSSLLANLFRRLSLTLTGKDITADLDQCIPAVRGGRLWFNLSNAFELVEQEKLAAALEVMDPLAANAIRNVNQEVYRSNSASIKELPRLVAARNPDKILRLLQARFDSRHTRRSVDAAVRETLQEMRWIAADKLPFRQTAEELWHALLNLALHHVVPAFLASRMAMVRLRESLPQDCKEDIDKLDQSLPGNVTVEMGFALYDLALTLPEGLSANDIRASISSGKLPPAFMDRWNAFLQRFGHRGAVELDVASSRYRDDPRMLIELLRESRSFGKDPRQRYNVQKQARIDAYTRLHTLMQPQGWAQVRRFESLCRTVETLGGLRETPKYCVIFMLDLLRSRILTEGDKLVSAGRLQRREQVFDLTFEQLCSAITNGAEDLQVLIRENRQFIDRLARVPQLPAIIDSRGRILRPFVPPSGSENCMTGTPISPGVYRGPVKCLQHAGEKKLLTGDILVARATDPGWTPLFVNAGAVILQIGGLLQHGALVAREYGLPCVGGIPDVLDLWPDGTVVEVDGSAGTVTVIH